VLRQMRHNFIDRFVVIQVQLNIFYALLRKKQGHGL
jgi:hypothetical protein